MSVRAIGLLSLLVWCCASALAAGPVPRDLTVREWVVQSIDGRQVADNSRTTLTFGPEGQLSGSAGCNRYSGGFELQGAGLQVKGMAATRMACGPVLMDQEARFLKALAMARSWRRQRDGSLLINGAEGHSLLAR